MIMGIISKSSNVQQRLREKGKRREEKRREEKKSVK